MNKNVSRLLLAAAAIALSGCNWLTGDDGLFRDRKDDYRQATLHAPLNVPEGLSSGAINDELAIPGTTTGPSLSGSFEIPRPEPLSGAAGADGVRLQRLGDDRWILVDAMPGEVWPRVRQFLGVHQLSVARVDAGAGVIETGWLQPSGATETRERYRFRIEQGVQRNSSEIFILQSQLGDGWPERSTHPDREAEMLEALAQYIADSGSTGSVSMLAQRALDARGRVFLERRGQQPMLRLDLPFERGWASLDAALPKAGFVVDDRNREARQFWVHYAPAEAAADDGEDEGDKRGWFGSLWHGLFGSDDADEEEAGGPEASYLVTVTSSGAPSGTPSEASGRDQLRIGIARQDGGELTPSQAEALLLRIKSKLS